MGAVPGQANVVGIHPWLPWPLCASRWWTRPVRAERLAALRIGLAAILLLDLLYTYLPDLHLFYGAGSLGAPPLFERVFKAPHWSWSLLHNVEDPRVFRWALVIWIVATVFMLLGLWTRLSVVIIWVLALSFQNLNDYNDNAGDDIRRIALFYLMLCPSGAVWSLDRWLGHWWARRQRPGPGPVYVYPWALRLLLIQLALSYFCNGVFKVFGTDLRQGDSLYYVLNDLTLARWSYDEFHLPIQLSRFASWSVLAWELTFPVVLMLPWWAAALLRVRRLRSRVTVGLVRFLRRVRVVFLIFGVLFHVGILVSLELGFFAPYMMALYLPLLPWERWSARRRLARARRSKVTGAVVEPALVPVSSAGVGSTAPT